MDLLQVKGKHIVDGDGKTVVLKGYCVGGWMNMENFINGYPGSEEGIRSAVAESIGKAKGEFFFDRMLDYVFAEDDVKFIKETGANVVRLALNYRHFEDDSRPFLYKESGFARLDRALDLCEKYGVYVILDMHAVQGWQNTDWHCDNSSRHTLFWKHPHFQERFLALWQEFARRYRGRAVVAGYDIMNEPIANTWRGRFSNIYVPDWNNFNRIYRLTVESIRKYDPRHIIFLEGDNFSELFDGMEAPFDDNLVYSSHNYIDAGFTGQYPGNIKSMKWSTGKEEMTWWDRKKQDQVFAEQEGTVFVKKHNVPYWMSEFGSVYNVPENEVSSRLASLDDQLGAFDDFGAQWTIWTYKDLGVMGSAILDPESDYMQIIKPVLQKKTLLNSDFGIYWLAVNRAKEIATELCDHIEQVINQPYVNTVTNRKYLGQAVFSEYTSVLLQPDFADRFKGMSEDRLDKVLASFAFKNCKRNEGLVNVLKKHML